MLDLFVAARLDEGQPPDPAGWTAALCSGQPEADQQRLCAFIERLISERAPLWHRLGALPRLAR
jgi:hypothetical protein